MDLAPIWDQLTASFTQLPRSGLLLAALIAMALGVLGTFLLSRLPAVGKAMRLTSTLGLMGILVLIVVQMSRLDPRFSIAVPAANLPEQVVSGGETRVPIAPDGHYWLRAQINGHEAAFMVDTGATLTAISPDTAQMAGLEPRTGAVPVRLQTANGVVAADLTTVDTLRVGNITAQGLDAVIAPSFGRTNVIGMNLLSRLASVRIEQNELILVPLETENTSQLEGSAR